MVNKSKKGLYKNDIKTFFGTVNVLKTKTYQ